MGVRVHKALGYGLTDFQEDSRFDFSKYSERAEELYEYNQTRMEYWVDSMSARIKELWGRVNGLDPETGRFFVSSFRTGEHPSFIQSDEFGLRNVVLFVPLGMGEWHRRDNDLDWTEETQSYQKANRVLELDRPPYPFDIVVYRDGSGRVPWRKCPEGEIRDGMKAMLPLELVASVLLWEPVVCNAEALLQQLKPLLYVYWG